MGTVVAVLAAMTLAQSASAATFTVNTTADHVEDKFCNAPPAGDCTLRDAVSLGGANDTINVPAGTYTLSLPGATEDLSATGDLDIVGDVNLIGAGSSLTTVSATDLEDRVLEVVSSQDGTVSIQGIGLTGGRTIDDGGGLFHRDGTLSIMDISLVGNSANSGGGLASFGGSGDVLTIDGLTADVNVSTEDGGGISLGANTGSSARITNAVISNNRAREGGGIAIGAQGSPLGPGALLIEHTRIEHNHAALHGGGVLGASFTLRDVVVDDNAQLA